MSQLVFAKTVLGANHMARGESCEDASDSYSNDQLGYAIVVVADGHGDATCVRSGTGAQFAVDAATESLKVFAEKSCESGCGIPGEQEIADLKVHVCTAWEKAIALDIAAHPISDAERVLLEKKGAGRGEAHLYGTTVVAALQTQRYLLLMQQGDGACAVVDRTGVCDLPVPGDERCVGNVTTSMADADARTEIRHCIVDTCEHSVIAAIVASDGVSKSLRGEDGIRDFAYWVLQAAQEGTEGQVVSRLEAGIAALSTSGSGDDASVGVIVNSEVGNGLLDFIGLWRERYALTIEMDESRSRLVSMSRKLEYLQAESSSGGDAALREYGDYRDEYDLIGQRVDELEGLIEELDEKERSAQAFVEEAKVEQVAANDALGGRGLAEASTKLCIEIPAEGQNLPSPVSSYVESTATKPDALQRVTALPRVLKLGLVILALSALGCGIALSCFLSSNRGKTDDAPSEFEDELVIPLDEDEGVSIQLDTNAESETFVDVNSDVESSEQQEVLLDSDDFDSAPDEDAAQDEESEGHSLGWHWVVVRQG